jgi:hypothetical protein
VKDVLHDTAVVQANVQISGDYITKPQRKKKSYSTDGRQQISCLISSLPFWVLHSPTYNCTSNTRAIVTRNYIPSNAYCKWSWILDVIIIVHGSILVMLFMPNEVVAIALSSQLFLHATVVAAMFAVFGHCVILREDPRTVCELDDLAATFCVGIRHRTISRQGMKVLTGFDSAIIVVLKRMVGERVRLDI